MKKTLIFYVEFTKNLSLPLPPPPSPRFFIQNKRHKGRETFFERGGGNSLKRTYVEEGGATCKTNRNEQGGRGVKNWKF